MGLGTIGRIHFIVSTCLLAALIMLMAGCGGRGTVGNVGAISEDYNVARGTAAPNQSPEAVPGAVPTAGAAPLKVRFFDDGSYDPDGYIVKWEWNFDDAGSEWEDYTATHGEAEHTYEKYGTRSPKLRVTDNGGKKDMAAILIDVKEWNNADPIAVGAADPSYGGTLEVAFAADDSYDPDGTIIKWEWDFCDGNGFVDCTGTEGKTTYEYACEGEYTAVLRVTDDDLATGLDSSDFRVGHPWPMFGQDCARRGRSPYVGPQTSDRKWTLDVGAGIYSSPAVASTGTIYFGCYDNNLYAVNPDGTKKWSFLTGDHVYSSPAIDIEGVVYIGSNDFYLYAINPDGTLKWKFLTGERIDSSPAIDESNTIYFGSRDNKLYALNPDGSQKWTFLTNGAIRSSPAIASNGDIYIGSDDSYVYALDSDGNEKWSLYTTGWPVSCTPTIGDDGTVYVGDDVHYFYAIDPDGAIQWRYPDPYPKGHYGFYGSAAIAQNGTIYMPCHRYYVPAIDPDGNMKWTLTTRAEHGRSAPAIGADGTYYFCGGWTVYAHYPGGWEKWYWQPYTYMYDSPAIAADGTLYIGTADGRLLAFGLDT